MDDIITHTEQDGRGRFFIEHHGARVAEMTYRRDDAARITIDHTFVDPSLRGRGVARRLLDAAAAWARATGTKITPQCAYVTVQFARDKSLADLASLNAG